MRLPNAENAVVSMDKIEAYCLNPDHTRGKHKARVFHRALGVGVGQASLLKEALLEIALTADALFIGSNEYGDHYFVDFFFEYNERRAELRSKWTVHSGENFPRRTSCYVKRKVNG